MRRNARLSNRENKSLSDKIILYCGIGVAVLAVIVIALLMYSKNLTDNVKNSTMSLEQMASIAGNNTSNTESASTQIGKSVEDSEIENNTTNTQNNDTNTINQTQTNTNMTNTIKTNTISTTKEETTKNKNNITANTEKPKQEENTTKIEETKKELNFTKPVEGEIVKEYAKDNLIYSETLKEWITHMGIDIKAEKTTVVKSAEAGTVKSIKNDPRYGLTIVVEHDDSIQTVYSNLLTSEFVVEGEKVEKGQSLGTVGNTAVFEIVDEPHLHFEILKDNIAVDPSIYLK